MALGNARAKADPARRWAFGCAIARPWQTVEEPALPHLVTPIPPKYAHGPRVLRAQGRQGRKTVWTSRSRLWRRHGGDVRVGWRKQGRNVSPQQPPSLGTTLAEWTPRQGVCSYQKRWALAWRHGAGQADLGVGEPQGSGDTNRSEPSVGIAVLAEVIGLRVWHPAMVPGKPGSLLQLQQALRRRGMTHQVEQTVKGKMAKTRHAAYSRALRLEGVNSEYTGIAHIYGEGQRVPYGV